MKDYNLRLEVTMDSTTKKPLAMYLRIRDGAVAETREVLEDRAYADYDGEGKLAGVELLAPCSIEVVDRIATDESDDIKSFLRGGISSNHMACV